MSDAETNVRRSAISTSGGELMTETTFQARQAARDTIVRRLLAPRAYETYRQEEESIAARFAKDSAGHRLEIAHDDGVNRHLRVARPGSGIQSFEVTTWPDHLAISGDMGDLTLQRTTDMFQIVRSNQDFGYYWAQKVVASGAPILEFSTTELASAIADHIDDLDATPAQMDALIDDLRVDVMTATTGADAMQRVEAFDSDLVSFQDFWEANLGRSSFRFLWLCHAIVLAVRLYDEAKGGATA